MGIAVSIKGKVGIVSDVGTWFAAFRALVGFEDMIIRVCNDKSFTDEENTFRAILHIDRAARRSWLLFKITTA